MPWTKTGATAISAQRERSASIASIVCATCRQLWGAAAKIWTADLLGSAVPLLQDLGIEAGWYVLRTEHEFDREVRALYAALNGAPGRWTADDRHAWERFSVQMREELGVSFDIAVVHDPQLI